MYKILSILFAFLSCQSFGQVQEFKLDNGLKILVKEDHRAPIAVSMIWYNVGSADEAGGITGVSHAIEHMMFKGTPNHPLGTFSKTIARLGGNENAITNNDFTAYFEKISANQLEACFALEADRMNNLLLDSGEFAKEIRVIQEERRMRTDDNPQALAFERFLATAHLTTAYSHPVIGWMEDLQHLQIGDLKQWYARYYAPNNATLVVVGDVNPKHVFLLAKKYFSSLPQKDIPIREPQKEPPSLGKKSIVVHAHAQLPLLLLGYTVPSVASSEKSWEPYALELIAGILDAGNSARFTRELIKANHLASGADAYYNLYSRYQTQFIVYGSPSKNHSIEELKKGLLEQLAQLKTQLVQPTELQRVKNQIIAQKTFEKDSIFGQAMELGLVETIGLSWNKAADYNAEINKITPEQIQEVAQRYFQENNSTEAELQPILEGQP